MKKLGAGRKRGAGKPPREMSGGCLALFGLPFLAAGLFMTWMFFMGFVEWWDARSWEEVSCRIVEAELERHSDSDGTRYRALATYRYRYMGVEYKGERVSFGMGSDNIGGFQRRAYRDLKRHEKSGKPFRCYVNPEEPEEAVLYRKLRWPMQAFMAIFALTFPAVGGGLVAGGIVSSVRAKRVAELRKRHPDEPWRWRPEWAERVVREGRDWWLAGLWVYTLWSGAVVWCLIGVTWMSGAFQEGGKVWLLSIFGVIWCVVAWFAVKRLRGRMMVGRSSLELGEWPVWPGGVMAGHVVLGRPLPMRSRAEVRLACQKVVVTSRGREQRTITEDVWVDGMEVTPAEMSRNASGFRLPVRFEIPAGVPETGADEGEGWERTRHEWKLEVRVPGTPAKAEFPVPVFRTENSPDPGEVGDRGLAEVVAGGKGDLAEGLAAMKVRAEFDAEGRPMSLVCPPCRNPGMLVFLFLFNLVWTGVAVVLVNSDAPFLFKIVWPVTAAGIWLGIVWSLLHKRSCRFDGSGLTLTNQLAWFAWTQAWEKREIVGFRHDSNMETNNKRHYRVRLESVIGQKKTLADGITSEGLAKALAARLEEWRKGG